MCLSSVAHAGREGGQPDIDFDDLNWERRDYDRVASYGQSKLANLLHARELAKRLEDAHGVRCHRLTLGD